MQSETETVSRLHMRARALWKKGGYGTGICITPSLCGSVCHMLTHNLHVGHIKQARKGYQPTNLLSYTTTTYINIKYDDRRLQRTVNGATQRRW